MSTPVKLPPVGDGIESADILEVFVHEGDVVKQGQNIVEVETGKATVVIESTQAGKVSKIHVKAGQTVPIGGPLISVEGVAAAEPAKSVAAPPKQEAKVKPEAKSPATPKPTPAAKPEAMPHRAGNDLHGVPAAKSEHPSALEAAKPVSAPAPVAVQPVGGEIIAAGPAIRRFAREVGVDLAHVTGTGEGGRITREDVLAVVRRASKGLAGAAAADVVTDEWGPVRYERMTKIRQIIAAKMHESSSTVPRVTNFDDADVTELEQLRASSKDDYAKKGIKLTSLPFVIKGVAMALRSHPAINASIDMEEDRIVYKQYVNIGIAVDTERGLVVPSLRGADQMSIPDIARALATLADNVRENKFSIDDLRGSTFTISNLGAIGGTYSTPIINVPEVAILLIGRSRSMPVVVDGEIAVRLMMPLSLSYDHRLVDGATAARFLNDVIGYLKAPSRLLLAP